MNVVTATRYHDLDCGHRVVGHEGKCRHLHGHSYRVHFICTAERLDAVGRVLDFSAIKERLCMWLEDNWDHRFLAWDKDDALSNLIRVSNSLELVESVRWVPFNPTAENMAEHLLRTVGPKQLAGTGVLLKQVIVEETRKCSASASLRLADVRADDTTIPVLTDSLVA